MQSKEASWSLLKLVAVQHGISPS